MKTDEFRAGNYKKALEKAFFNVEENNIALNVTQYIEYSNSLLSSAINNYDLNLSDQKHILDNTLF